MAKNKNLSYNDIPDKNEDWGLDPRNGFKYSGESVQKFIKETFNSKMGYFYYDTSSNRYLVFADEASKNEYVENPTLTELVLGSFDAPFNYEASITMLTPSYNAVFLGSNGNYLDFTFDVKNKAGNSTGENVTVTYTFIRNATKKVLTETRRYGETVHFNIDDYLLEGTNTIIVGISGQTTLAATTAALAYQVVNLSYSDEKNIARVYDLSQGAYTMEVFFNVSGYGTKIVEWFLDGNQLEFVKSEDEVVDVTAQRTKYIELSNLTSGIHTIQSRAYTLVNGDKFYTDTLYREIMVNNGDTTANVVAVAANVPNSHGIVTGSNPFLFYGAEQYIPYEIRFATRKTGNVSVYLGGELAGTLTSSANTESRYSVTSNKAGTLSVKFIVDGVEREIPLSVNKTSLNIEEIKTSLSFDFRATGKSNTSVDKDVWSYGDYTATFEGFNWNASSGWVENSLLINNGASFSVDIAPLAKDATSTGKTLEFEFSTRNVENDDAVICDLTTNGKGLLITASEARLTSAAGEVVSTRFKAGEVNRIAFVINRKTGVTYKGLVFIYVNGILSGAVNYGSADNFTSSKQLAFVGTEDAQVELRAMRFYDTALSADNVLNNYVIYRDTLNEMMEVYYRNEIYAEGTQIFSPDAMLHRLPVMVITGDVPTLEAATSTSTQILVDIDYTNEQDPTKNFKMKNAALRIQGTSSLAYPRKNFRFYTQKEASTIVYDSEGKKIESKLYSFKDGAQPVDCWCLKADFAESSGTHNTAIARLWNKAMYGAIIQHKNVLGEEVNGYALRTNAQIAALNAGYEYDVRTTIDGFPIVLFYKKNANDTDLIFLGKYNFNNDKSTPSVFGFENIPDFDNSRMQCWETKDNGHPLGLFTDVSRFDADWSEAFESRYPDTKTPNTADLKAFSVWMNGVSQSDFITQKWAHFDVYKVAAYYCYLMRFGAVDQPVKNAFITSEDGEKFYFINYDNDTINGLINTGRLALDPTVNRDTIGSDGEYVYAGHNSVLWNRLTNDAEFMEIVSIVDNALYSAGLRYDEVIAEFNEGQADKWVERVYNQDAEYKYLLPYVNQATNNLFMLQGARSSHRSWWLSKRFSLYDSLFLSGAYRDRNISFKCLNDTQPNQEFTITAATKMNYGYGVNNGIRETGVEVDKGGTHTFVTTDTLNLGDVVKVFASANLEALDLSKLADRLAVLDCSAAAAPSLGTKMKKLILGGAGKVNTELAAISGINVLASLQELNVEGYQNTTTLNLTAQKDLRKVFAKGSSVASIDFAAGAPVEHLELPSAMMALNFNQLPYLTFDNLVFESGLANIHSLNIYGCPNLTNDFSFVQRWLEEKTTIDSSCTIAMDNVDWVASYEDFLAFSQHKVNGMSLELRGKVYLSSLSLEQATQLQEIWGNDCFDKGVEFRITAPDALYINPSSATINEGESLQFSYVLLSSTEGSVKYSIAGGVREGATLDVDTGLFTTLETGASDNTMYIRATYTSNEGSKVSSTATVIIRKRIYPTSNDITITGSSTINGDETYSWSVSSSNVNGDIISEWSLSGSAFNDGYVSFGEVSESTCVVSLLKFAEKNQTISGTLTLTLKKRIDGSVVATKTKTFSMAKYNYPTASDTTITGDTEPSMQGSIYTWQSTATGNIGPISAVWSLDESLLSFFEITEQQIDENNPLYGSCKVTKVFDSDFYAKANLKLTITYINTGTSFTINKQIIVMSENLLMTEETNKPVLTVLYNNGLCANSTYMTKAEAANVTNTQLGKIFYGNASITHFDEFQYFTKITKFTDTTFRGCSDLCSIVLPNNLEQLYNSAFLGTKIEYIKIPEKVTIIPNSCFKSSSLKNIEFLGSITTIGDEAFYSTNIESINLQETITTIGSSAFVNCSKMESITLPSGVTSISRSLFLRCKKLKNIEILGNVKSIDEDAFSETAIESFIIPDSVTSVGNSLFNQCNQLKTIHIGSGLSWFSATYITSPILENITVSDENLSLCSDGFNGVFNKDKTTLYLGGLKTIIPEGVTDISDYCFSSRRITEIILPSTLLYIRSNVFKECSYLENIALPQNLKLIGADAFEDSGLKSITLPENIKFDGGAHFRDCKSLTTADLSKINVEYLPSSMFQGCTSLSNVILPQSLISIISNCFYNCGSLINITIPENVTSIEGNVFYGTSLGIITFKSIQAPSVNSTAFSNLSASGDKIIYIPINSSGYDNSWINNMVASYGYTVKFPIDVTECTLLTITADDVTGREMQTKIYWTAIVNGIDNFSNLPVTDVELTGIAMSDEFPKNTSETETVEREISFTYMGVTATTTIIQGVWISSYYSVVLNDQWELSTSVANPDSALYDGVYQSFSNKGKDDQEARCYIDFVGYETFKVYIRSYAEGKYDYVVISNLDAELSKNPSSTSTGVIAHTSGNQNSGTSISDYTLVEYTGLDGGEHRITVVYRKDSSSASGDDRGYLLIPKNQ